MAVHGTIGITLHLHILALQVPAEKVINTGYQLLIGTKFFSLEKRRKRSEMMEICVYGRGGQGGVTFAELVAQAAIREGKYAQASPTFSPERRGAPVLSYLRVNETGIKIRTEIAEPDVVVVLDPGLLHVGGVVSRLKKEGVAVVNTKRSPEKMRADADLEGASKIAVVDAMSIAKKILGLPIVNTAMIGALIKATGVVKLESMEEPMNERFRKVAAKNIDAMRRAYEETVVG